MHTDTDTDTDTDTMSAANNKMSDVRGAGHGSVHMWKKGVTAWFHYNGPQYEEEGPTLRCGSCPRGTRLGSGDRHTHYNCTHCGAAFVHRYNEEPDIFKSMKSGGVPLECRR